MKLRFRNTIDDLVAFSCYFHERSPLIKPQARGMAMMFFLLVLLTFAMIVPWRWWNEKESGLVGLTWLFGLAAATCVALVIYFLWKPYMLRKIGQAVRKVYRSDPD